MLEQFGAALFPEGFMPHGHCYLWLPQLVWLHATSDGVIALAYFSIPFALIQFMRKRKDLAFRRVFAMYGVFILSCGVTHVLSIVDIWVPTYWVEGYVKAFTAVVSIATAAVMWPLIPRALALPSPSLLAETNRALEAQVLERNVAEEALRLSRDDLEVRVLERTAELRDANARLMLEIEERKHAETQLEAKHAELQKEVGAREEVELQYRELFAQAPDALLLVDPESLAVIRYNTAGAQLLGSAPNAPPRNNLSQLTASPFRDELLLRIRGVVETGHDSFESSCSGSEGQVQYVAVSVYRVEVGGRKLAMSLVRDITPRRQLEDETQKAQRLESIGHLAGGIAHDFNNLLMVIVGNLSLAKDCRPIDSEQDALIEQATRACERAQGLTRQLLAFAKGGMPAKTVAFISDVVREGANFAIRGSSTRCDFESAADLWLGEFDEGQISQVVCNLVLNAVQSMPSGGAVHIRCDNVTISESGTLPLSKGRYVRFSVRDEGTGIAPERLRKIFDPYFTTKSRGNGLGLSSSYSIVKRHGGHIEVLSVVDAGSTFSVYLPASEEKSPSARAAQASAHAALVLRVLVMDDERLIRDVACKMLARLGHSVEVAENGQAAIDKYREALASGARFDAVLLDLTVPGAMGGKETVVALRQLDPRVAAIASSGYAGDDMTGEFESLGFAAILTKPYNVLSLKNALAAAIARASSPDAPTPS